mmetsp:Transcript_51389/g.128947  ORF Transcript_51389/g.128947 Transcript_51389/m.128947 type:complete len:317 (-) Transcript_51389:26-976(-)
MMFCKTVVMRSMFVSCSLSMCSLLARRSLSSFSLARRSFSASSLALSFSCRARSFSSSLSLSLRFLSSSLSLSLGTDIDTERTFLTLLAAEDSALGRVVVLHSSSAAFSSSSGSVFSSDRKDMKSTCSLRCFSLSAGVTFACAFTFLRVCVDSSFRVFRKSIKSTFGPASEALPLSFMSNDLRLWAEEVRLASGSVPTSPWRKERRSIFWPLSSSPPFRKDRRSTTSFISGSSLSSAFTFLAGLFTVRILRAIASDRLGSDARRCKGFLGAIFSAASSSSFKNEKAVTLSSRGFLSSTLAAAGLLGCVVRPRNMFS